MSASVPLVSSSYLASTSVSLAGGSHEGMSDVHMMEMRAPEDIKPCVSLAHGQMGGLMGEFKTAVGGMDVDPMLLELQTKTELR